MHVDTARAAEYLVNRRLASVSGTCFLSRLPLSSLALRPGDSLTIHLMALSVGFIRFVSSMDATHATKVSDIDLMSGS